MEFRMAGPWEGPRSSTEGLLNCRGIDESGRVFFYIQFDPHEQGYFWGRKDKTIEYMSGASWKSIDEIQAYIDKFVLSAYVRVDKETFDKHMILK